MRTTTGLSRRDFLKYSAALGVQVALPAPLLIRTAFAGDAPRAALPLDLAVAHGDSPARNCLAAVDALGGFSRFVRQGDRVVIKPNPVGANPPEQAISTHPEMVETVVRECVRAGAKQVVVLSNDGMRSFVANGIRAATERAGGIVKAVEDPKQYREVVVPRGRILRRERIATDLVESDVFINMPIAKHHAGTEVTLSMKNLMGVNWDRLHFHQTDLHQCIAELTATVRHSLIIMDANHVLLTNGPAGPGEVLKAGKVIAGVDPVAMDAFATRAFWPERREIRHIRIAYDLGAGEIDLAKLRIKEFEA